ncbi:MAG: S41 family peptidase [Candidatus Neomarinimicrobiota bacterium]|nr:S41 family peptidase [Candidatus Neomarinimicrobiota bacterium]
MRALIKPKYLLLIVFIGTISISFTQSGFYRKIANSQSLINQVYTQIFSTYVDQLDPETFTKSSINSITENLDPYTTLLVEDEQYNINLLTDGKYGGVGIQLGYRNKEMTVISPMIDSPAQKAGIVGGDIIIKIDEVDVKDLSFNDAAAKIRGKRGTKVKLTVKRYGYDDTIEFTLTRSRIDVKDVTYADMISSTTGYIRLNRFSRFTPRDFQNELLQMSKQNLSELIIDLRDNTGGLLSAAVNILDMLVDKDLPLVSTKGRTKESNRAFFSKRDPIISKDVKIIVLINEGSASASEIVAGAIQDLDRGLVIGKKSFGKGLVQTAYEIDKKRTIKITTARYYIPSGRFIQKRDYVDEKFLLNKAVEDSLFKTKKGRIVYSNGGITPDSSVSDMTMDVITSQFWRKGYFYSFAQKNKHLYENFDQVQKDPMIIKKFIDFTKGKNDLTLPGKKELSQLEKDLYDLDSSNVSIKKAVKQISEFYDAKIEEKSLAESEDMKEILFLEFAGLFNGPKGRIEQSFKTDNMLKTAIDIISDQYLYSYTFKNNQFSNN